MQYNIVPTCYFIIDGSALNSQIRQLRRKRPFFSGRKLCPVRFAKNLSETIPIIRYSGYNRITFYFPVGDESAVEDYLEMPSMDEPGLIRNMHFKFCGQKIKKSAEFQKFVEEKVPPKYHDRVNKSEKGIDIEMCCDAIRLASIHRNCSIFLLTNDDDFKPLCRTIKDYGANVGIVHLHEVLNKNVSLLKEVDSFDVIRERYLKDMFIESVKQGKNQDLPQTSGKQNAADAQKLKMKRADEADDSDD